MRFRVKSRLEHDGKSYAAGEFVELTAAAADAMPHAVEAAPEPPPPAPPAPPQAKKGK